MNYFAKVIKLSSNIAKDKNKALKEAIKSDKNYFFLIEDNCKVLDDSVYSKFIETSDETGIHALMWAGGGPNKRLPFEEDKYIQYYSDFIPSFTMYTRKAVETVGFFDEEMPPNTWQELEYVKRIGDHELGTPFGIFAAPRGVDYCFFITKPTKEYRNVKQLDEGLRYWEAKQMEDFPIEIKDKVEEIKSGKNKIITEMI